MPTIAPLVCPKDGAPCPLGDGEVTTCPRCAAEVGVSPELHQLRSDHIYEDYDDRLRTLLGTQSGILKWWSGISIAITGVVGGFFAILIWFGTALMAIAATCAVIGVLAFGDPRARARGAVRDRSDRSLRRRARVRVRRDRAVRPGDPARSCWRMWLDERALGRSRLASQMRAHKPVDKGGPPICRACGGALELLGDPVGVRCLYCRADNLLKVPAVPAKKGGKQAKGPAPTTIDDAIAHADTPRANAPRGRSTRACSGSRSRSACCTRSATSRCGSTKKSIRSAWSKMMGKTRTMVSLADELPPIPIDTTAHLAGYSYSRHYYVALKKHETWVLRGRRLDARAHVEVTNTTTFPGLERDADINFQHTLAGDWFVAYTAPYTGLFKVTLRVPDGWAKTDYDLDVDGRRQARAA